MNGTSAQHTTTGRTVGALRPAFIPTRASDREVVREICVNRSLAGFLGTRWLQLLDDATDPQLRALEDATRHELKRVVRRYARELLQLGESRSTMVSLVSELATQVASQCAHHNMSQDDVRDELVEWVRDVSPAAEN